MSTIEIGEVFLVTSLPVLLVTPAVGYVSSFFAGKKKETTGTMKFLTISQLMGKSKNPLLMGVYPVVGDVFMMLGMALVCAKRARLSGKTRKHAVRHLSHRRLPCR